MGGEILYHYCSVPEFRVSVCYEENVEDGYALEGRLELQSTSLCIDSRRSNCLSPSVEL